MISDYQKLADSSKVFIFPAERNLRDQEVILVERSISDYLQGLTEIDCSFEIRNDRFLVIAVSDETRLDLDQHNQLIERIGQLESELGMSLIDKVYVFFKQGQYIQRKAIPEFQNMIKQGAVSKGTLVFDLMVQQKYDLDNFWLLPAADSWLSYLFKK